MVVTLLNWIYIFATAYILGFYCLPRVAALIDKESRLRFNWCDNIVAGIVIATVYAGFFSLIGGVGIAANVLLVICCVLFMVLDRKRISKPYAPAKRMLKNPVNILLIVIGAGLFVLNLMFTAESTFHYDTGLYHAQAIHWIEDYGVIKGLGFIHVRLAYNSAYFPLCALYSMRDVTGGQSLHSVSGFISVVMCLYSVYGWIKATAGRTEAGEGSGSHIISSCIRFASIIYFAVCILEITSPESDYITVNLIIWILLRSVEVYEAEEDGNKLAGYCLLAICSFALVGYKLSAAVIAMITIWPLVILIKKKNLKGIIVSGILCVLMVLPYLIRNVMICGWLVYPVDSIDLFNVPWKFDKDVLTRDAGEIGDWAKSMNVNGKGGSSWFGWIPAWWQEQFLATRMFISSMLMSIPVMVISFFDRKKWFIKFLMAVISVSLIFYLIKAPLIRYCYGPVLVLPLMVMGYALDRSVSIMNKTRDGGRRYLGVTVMALVLAAVITICIPSVYSMKELIKFDYEEAEGRFSHRDYIVKQVDYPIADVREVDWYGYKVYLPNDLDQCWYYAFPSSPYHECFDGNRPSPEGLEKGVEHIGHNE